MPDGVELEQAEAGDDQEAGGDHPDPRGRGAMRLPTRAQSPAWVGSAEPNVGRFGQNIQRPKITSSAGSRVTITRKVTATPTASTGPRPAVELRSAKARHSMPDDYGGRAGQDGRRRAVQGERHRLVPVVVTAELFSVARDQQQCVVGAGADDQDAEDRLALPVDGQVGVLGQQVDHAAGDHVGDGGAEDRQQPQQRAAVGEQQDHDHDQERDQDQVGVDALERLGRVGRLAAVAGEVHGDPVDLGDRRGPRRPRPGCRSSRSCRS